MAVTVQPRISVKLSGGHAVLALFSLTLLTSAFLLFSIQPFFAKMVLPRLGGSPGVWSVAMVFFQGVLLLGYGYAHLLTARLRTGQAVAVHALVMIAAFAALPITIAEGWGNPPHSHQELWLLGLFVVSVGLPFFAISANGPLLQAWFARTGHAHAADPYFLYGASNLGSLASLVLYIILFEPLFAVSKQSALWTGGFVLLSFLVLLCGVSALARRGAETSGSPTASVARPGVAQILRWAGLAFVPSGLLVAVTAHLSVDVAAAPFLWVMPLILFLLTFVLAFQRRPLIGSGFLVRAVPWAGALALTAVVVPGQFPIAAALAIHLTFFFLAALLCHSILVSHRPPAENLTSFYLWMSFGGVLGGIFASLVAPVLFEWVAEYPLLIIASLLCRPDASTGPKRRLAGDAAALLIVGGLIVAAAQHGWLPSLTMKAGASIVLLSLIVCGAIVQLRSGRAYAMTLVLLAPLVFLLGRAQGDLFIDRSFFGVIKVAESADGAYRFMMHGTTIHGAMATAGGIGSPPMPLTYYHATGGMARAVAAVRERRGGILAEVGVIGLGTGSILCHRAAGERWTSYEIDPSVVRVASNPALFRFVPECGNGDPIIIGDARLRLVEASDGKYDLLIIDAFSSDAIPAHLMTREAVALYRSKLKQDGVLVMHISNRHLELATVVAAIAESLRMEIRVGLFGGIGDQTKTFVTPNRVAVLANTEEALGSMADTDPWKKLTVGSVRVWTDDYSNVLSALWRAL